MSVEKLPHNPGVLLQPPGRQLVYSISEGLRPLLSAPPPPLTRTSGFEWGFGRAAAAAGAPAGEAHRHAGAEAVCACAGCLLRGGAWARGRGARGRVSRRGAGGGARAEPGGPAARARWLDLPERWARDVTPPWRARCKKTVSLRGFLQLLGLAGPAGSPGGGGGCGGVSSLGSRRLWRRDRCLLRVAARPAGREGPGVREARPRPVGPGQHLFPWGGARLRAWERGLRRGGKWRVLFFLPW